MRIANPFLFFLSIKLQILQNSLAFEYVNHYIYQVQNYSLRQ